MSEFNKGYYRRQGRVQGAVEEQARIIKLLEEIPSMEIRTEDGKEILSVELKDIIELIKGKP